MGEAVRMLGDGDAGEDGKEAEGRPRPEPGPDFGPLRKRAGAVGARQLVDDFAEQQRFGELRASEGDFGEDERRREPFFRSEEAEDASIETHERHGGPVQKGALERPCGRRCF